MILKTRGLTKSFSGNIVLKGIDFELERNEVHGLVGENGAGKSTFMKVLVGIYNKDSGEIIVNGEKWNNANPKLSKEKGLSMALQEGSLLPNLRVYENIFLGFEDKFSRFGFLDKKQMEKKAENLLNEIGFKVPVNTFVRDLDSMSRQIVEIAKCISVKIVSNSYPILLFDEPTTALDKHSIQLLIENLTHLKKEASIIFTSHHLSEVLEVSDRVTIFRDGESKGTFVKGELSLEKIFKLMTGRSYSKEYYKRHKQKPYSERVVMQVIGLTKEGAYKNVSFDLHEGEVLGLAGLIGSGKEQLGQSIVGLIKPDNGRITCSFNNATKVGFIPPDRFKEGLIPMQSVRFNISLPSLKKVKSTILPFLISGKKETELASKWVEALRIKTPSLKTFCRYLSGGNQQKVIIAKWLEYSPKILVMMRPTEGLDVGVKEDVYDLIREIAQKGISVLLISDDLPELIEMSHTLLIMRDGEVVKKLDAPKDNKPTENDIIKYMV